MKTIENIVENVIENVAKTTYKGKVKNLISIQELCYKTDTEDIGNNLVKNDLIFLKFTSNGKVLLVSDRNIKNKISWDQLNKGNLVFGKIVEINSIKYKIRLLTSGEWDKLIVNLTPKDSDSHWKAICSWCQNVYSIDYLKRYYSYYCTCRVMRGYYSVSNFSIGSSSDISDCYSWRPVLEML